MVGIITSLPPLVEQPPGNNASNPAGLPGVTYVAANLNLAQTWGAKQTFGDNNLILNGATSGSLTLRAADVAGINSAIRFPAGSTDFSATGGTSQVVKQTSIGGSFTVGQLAFTDISGSIAAAQLPALTGDVTTTAGTAATTIALNAVTNAKAAQMAATTLKGNATGSTANASDLTGAQVEQMLLFTQTGTGAVQRTLDAKIKDHWISVKDFGAKGDGVTNDTAAILAAIQAVPSGSTLLIPPGTYVISEMSATTIGHINIVGYGATLVNTTQVASPFPSGLPILRIFVRTQAFDVSIEGINIQGPRLTSSTTVGAGGYGGDPLNPGSGYPSGIDIPIGRNVTIRNCTVSGTYYAGIEVHYAKKAVIKDNNVFNHGFSGITVTDTDDQYIDGNVVDDIGSVAPNDGYGINAGTSYNTPGYTFGNKRVWFRGNTVTRCKRKGLDVHSGLYVEIANNWVKGCAYGHIYAVCEGSDKQIADVSVHHNKCYGDATFGTGSSADAAIIAGTFGTPSQDTNVNVDHNHLGTVVAPVGVFLSNNNVAAGVGICYNVDSNTMSKCVFSDSAIASNNWSQLLTLVSVKGNLINANVTNAHINLKVIKRAQSINNICEGTSGTTVTTLFTTVTTSIKGGNYFNGTLDP